jgi:hypothetical protein
MKKISINNRIILFLKIFFYFNNIFFGIRFQIYKYFFYSDKKNKKLDHIYSQENL